MKRQITEKRLSSFKNSLWENEKSQNTIDKYMRDIRFFAIFSAGKDITKNLTIEYKSVLIQKYTVTSANSMLAALNSFFKFCGWGDLCVKQFRLQRSPYRAEEKELTETEYRALVCAAEQKNNERLSLVIQTICGTGIRVSELSYITVDAVKRGEAVVSCKGKTRTVFIVAALRKKLLKYAKEKGISSGYVFITSKGKPLNRSNIWAEMKKLCESAKVNPEKVFPHNLRHLFARTFYGLEKDIAKLADILGHSNISTTRIYIVTTGTEHKRKMENMRLII